MRRVHQVRSWVVYETPATGRMGTMQVVCEEGEWEKLRADAGLRLVKGGIASEPDAERIARQGTPALAKCPRAYR